MSYPLSGLIASDYVVVPLSPDLFSLQGLKNLGPAVTLARGMAGAYP
jgi:cellulose biosynthesis protein BcsQ